MEAVLVIMRRINSETDVFDVLTYPPSFSIMVSISLSPLKGQTDSVGGREWREQLTSLLMAFVNQHT